MNKSNVFKFLLMSSLLSVSFTALPAARIAGWAARGIAGKTLKFAGRTFKKSCWFSAKVLPVAIAGEYFLERGERKNPLQSFTMKDAVDRCRAADVKDLLSKGSEEPAFTVASKLLQARLLLGGLLLTPQGRRDFAFDRTCPRIHRTITTFTPGPNGESSPFVQFFKGAGQTFVSTKARVKGAWNGWWHAKSGATS